MALLPPNMPLPPPGGQQMLAPPQIPLGNQMPGYAPTALGGYNVPSSQMGGMAPPPPAAPPPPVMLHDVKVVTRKTYKCAKVEGVPPEEFGTSRLTKTMRDCNYAFHYRPTKTQGELVAEGYDEDQVTGLATSAANQTLESIARDTVNEQSEAPGIDSGDNRPVATTEHYIRIDYEEKGKPKLYRVVTAGESEQILLRDGKPDIQPVDFMPFAAMTPRIITHRFYGRSIADNVMDIQRIKTSLLRGALDNIYLANNQRMEISEQHAGKNTIDDLLTNRPGGIVRTKQPGGLIPIPNNPLGQFIFPMIEYMDSTRDSRTGANKQSMGLDADALQNQSATSANLMFRAAEAQVKLIARIFAETGIRDLFSLLHATIRKNDREQSTVRLRNKWVTIDPRNWKTRNDMTINTGLGTGTKVEQRMAIMQILDIQKQAAMMPGAGLAKPKNIFNSLKKLVELSGLKSVDPYFTDPDEPQLGPDGHPIQATPAPPDPKMLEAQQNAQLAQTKAQADIAATQHDMQLAQAKAQADVQMTQADIVANQKKIDGELELARARFEFERDMAERAYQMQLELHNAKLQQMSMSAFDGLGGGKQPSESINYKDVTNPQAQEQMLQQAGLTPAGEQPAQPAAQPQSPVPGAPTGARPPRVAKEHPIVTMMGHMARGQEAVAAGLHALAAAHTAPKRVVRDPTTNQIVGAETMPFNKGTVQ